MHILTGGHPAGPRELEYKKYQRYFQSENIIQGHEYTGVIKEVGRDVKYVLPGDKVVLDPNIKCGKCISCKEGKENQCTSMTTLGIFLDGGFAKYNIAPEKSLFKIPKDMTAEQAVLAEPLSCVLNGYGKLNIKGSEKMAILGAGTIGMLFLGLLNNSPHSKLLVSEPNDYKRDLAEKLGADIVINPLNEEINEKFDIVIDAVGSLASQGIEMLRNGGKLLLFGMNEKVYSNIHPYTITRNELYIIGTFIAKNTFPKAVDLLYHGESIKPKDYITKKYALNDLIKGFDLAKKGNCIKIMIKL